MALTHPELYRLVSEFRIDDGSAPKSFARRLQKEHGWSPDFTALAMREYLRFMYLAKISSSGVSPAKAVDEVWHLHLTFSRSYWKDFCGAILEKEIHHEPGNGLPGESFRDVFAETLSLYRREFGEEPPAVIWLSTLEKKKSVLPWLGVAATLVLVAIGCASESGSDAGFSTIFSVFFFLVVVGFIAGIVGIWRLIRGDSRPGYGGYVESSCGSNFIIDSAPIIINSDPNCSAPPSDVNCSSGPADSSPSDSGSSSSCSSSSSSCSSSSSSCSSSSCSSS